MRADSLRWHRNREIDYSLVEQVQRIWGIKFPREYTEVIVNHDGAQPEILNESGEWKSGLVKIKDFGSVTFGFLRYFDNSNVECSNIMFTYKCNRGTLPDAHKIFPFADDGGGNHLYFDYRMNESNPSIVFQHHEKAISKEDLSDLDLEKRPLEEWLNDSLIPVADSFERLLEMLYPAEW